MAEEPPEEAEVFPVKRGHRAKTDLRKVMESAFGDVEEDGDWLVTSFELINEVRARYYKKSQLWVINDQKGPDEIDFETEMDAAVATREAWNNFLNNASGYTPKERRDKFKQWAKEGRL